jgi:hypothetical protein
MIYSLMTAAGAKAIVKTSILRVALSIFPKACNSVSDQRLVRGQGLISKPSATRSIMSMLRKRFNPRETEFLLAGDDDSGPEDLKDDLDLECD